MIKITIFYFQFRVSLSRINNYMKGDEIDEDSITNQVMEERVLIKNGSFSWSRGEKASLNNIELSVKPKELVAIVGRVGTGKSSLLSALLGDVFKINGDGKSQIMIHFKLTAKKYK